MLGKLLIASLLIPAAVFGQQWKLIAPMQDGRAGFAIAVLNNGEIIVSGGASLSGVLRSTEIYDTKMNTWSSTGDLNIGRRGTAFTKLFDGRMYYASGLIDMGTSVTSTCEIYDPLTGIWSLTANVLESREGGSAITLPNGNVLNVAGTDGVGYFRRSCEIFDPMLQTEKFTDSISVGQFGNVVFLDTNTQKVIMISDHTNGSSGPWFNETEEYDIASSKWSVTAHSQAGHGSYQQMCVQLPSGEILAPSGGDANNHGSSLIEIYTSATKSWRTIGTMPIPHYLGTSVYIGGDSVLNIGGFDGANNIAMDNTWFINIKTGQVTAGPKLNERRYWQRAVAVFTSDPCSEKVSVYVFGGQDESNIPKASCEVLEFQRGTPSVLSLPQPLSFNGTVCAGIDTSVSISASTCSEFHIDSVIIEGLANSSINTKLPDTLKNGESKILQLSLHSTIVGLNQGFLRIFYNIGGSERDTSIPIIMNLRASTRGTIRSVIHDIINGGDTVFIPIYLASNSGDRAQGFQMTAHYNTDLLTPIDPEFAGALTQNATVWDQNQISGGMNFFAQQPFSISTSNPLVILKFKTAVTKDECTSFVIDNLQITFDSTGNNTDPCQLSVTGDSAMICRENG